jgi:phosphoribosylformimino-5-aminoimidazole carboxamide ribotide isomerase
MQMDLAGQTSHERGVLALRDLGTAGVVLGSALYSGKISLEAALEVCR